MSQLHHPEQPEEEAYLARTVATIDQSTNAIQNSHGSAGNAFTEEVIRENQRKSLQALQKQRPEPYFARADFQEKGQERAIAYYLGIGNVSEYGRANYLVRDFNGPIGALFYSRMADHAIYKSKDESVEGEVLLRRRYTIAGL